MNVEVRGESVVITGYVNAVERYSKPITSTLRGCLRTFVERMRAGVFKTALKRNDSVKVLLNHDMNREIANTSDGSAKLVEDNIGLRAEVTITDKEVVEKARKNQLVGWSFGFYANSDEIGTEGDVETRTVTDMDLVEVSILDDTKRPAYNGTSIETRTEGGTVMEIREEMFEQPETTTEKREEGVEIDALADVVAKKVVEMLRAEKRTEETEVVEENATTEGVATETEEQSEEESTEEEEKTENRAIDYSEYEQRIAKL